MRAHVVAVGPYARVRIIDEVHRIRLEIVQVVFSGRVGCGGNSEALVRIVGLARGDNELREHPAAGEEVVRNDRVAVVVRCADAA